MLNATAWIGPHLDCSCAPPETVTDLGALAAGHLLDAREGPES